MEASQAVERAARDSYGRLLAFLSCRTRDLAAAEDALSDAFLSALKTWPRDGVPERPEAWLLTSARRKLIDRARKTKLEGEILPALAKATEIAAEETTFPDERLKLLFVCAHPAIEAAARTPLMLQTVLGLDAARIASAFLVKPTAMGQRLSRAKAKIRDARISFDVPDSHELPERLDSVLEAIYAAYGSGWEDVAGSDARRKGLAEEAIDLGRLLTDLLPKEPEAKGLLALMLHCEARRAARRLDGAYIPLSEQDVNLWSKPMIQEAEARLTGAAVLGRIGHFQLEAAIQSAHAQRVYGEATSWEAITLLYEALVQLAPTTGALVSRAAAIAELKGPKPALCLLEEIPEGRTAAYQPYWALKAHLLNRLDRKAEAQKAYERAIGLTEDPAARAFLTRKAKLS